MALKRINKASDHQSVRLRDEKCHGKRFSSEREEKKVAMEKKTSNSNVFVNFSCRYGVENFSECVYEWMRNWKWRKKIISNFLDVSWLAFVRLTGGPWPCLYLSFWAERRFRTEINPPSYSSRPEPWNVCATQGSTLLVSIQLFFLSCVCVNENLSQVNGKSLYFSRGKSADRLEIQLNFHFNRNNPPNHSRRLRYGAVEGKWRKKNVSSLVWESLILGHWKCARVSEILSSVRFFLCSGKIWKIRNSIWNPSYHWAREQYMKSWLANIAKFAHTRPVRPRLSLSLSGVCGKKVRLPFRISSTQPRLKWEWNFTVYAEVAEV